MALTPKGRQDLCNEMKQSKEEEARIKASQDMDRKSKNDPFAQYCLKQQVELDSLQQLRDKRANAALQGAQAVGVEDFAFEMNKMKTEQLREEKLRQQLRENCPELRELRRKLNAAYVNKVVTEQIKEKEARRVSEQIQERELNEKIKRAHVPEHEFFKVKKEEEMRQKAEYKQALQDQMIFQENTRRAKYEEFLKEKKLIDELVQRIQEEEEREVQRKYCNMLKTQEDIKQFKDNQEIWRNKAKERVKMEDLAIQRFIQEKMEQSKKSAEEKAEREAIKARICDEMAKKIYIEKRKQTEKDEILSELLEAEERESIERKHREDVEKQIRNRIETHRALNAQMEERLEKLRQENERDTRYKEELLAQMAENERLEQLTSEKRRIRMLQLRRDIEETIKANRMKKAVDMQVQLMQHEILKEEAEKRRVLIEDERVRMIKEHAENLLGFMPAGIMTESEMNKLDEDLKQKLKCAVKKGL